MASRIPLYCIFLVLLKYLDFDFLTVTETELVSTRSQMKHGHNIAFIALFTDEPFTEQKERQILLCLVYRCSYKYCVQWNNLQLKRSYFCIAAQTLIEMEHCLCSSSQCSEQVNDQNRDFMCPIFIVVSDG